MAQDLLLTKVKPPEPTMIGLLRSGDKLTIERHSPSLGPVPRSDRRLYLCQRAAGEQARGRMIILMRATDSQARRKIRNRSTASPRSILPSVVPHGLLRLPRIYQRKQATAAIVLGKKRKTTLGSRYPVTAATLHQDAILIGLRIITPIEPIVPQAAKWPLGPSCLPPANASFLLTFLCNE